MTTSAESTRVDETPERPVPSLLYDATQDALRLVVREILSELSPWPAVTARLDRPYPYDAALWAQLSRSGVAGLLIPEPLGGSGGSASDMAVALEEIGRAVAPVPALTSAVLATVTLTGLVRDAQDDAVANLLGTMASGDMVVAPLVPLNALPGDGWSADFQYANGRVSGSLDSVVGAAGCHHGLVPARDGAQTVLLLVNADAEGVDISPRPCLDMTRPISQVQLRDASAVPIATGAQAQAALRAGLVAATALLASEQLGTAEQALENACDHLRTRFQFGRLVGSFQALRHGAAELWTDLTGARAAARYAAACLADGDEDAELAAHLAQAVCAEVSVETCEGCLQMTGGIGFTWEHPTHLLLKRAASGLRLLGSPEAHRRRIGELRELDPP